MNIEQTKKVITILEKQEKTELIKQEISRYQKNLLNIKNK